MPLHGLSVYLAGPITGLSFAMANSWRVEATDEFRRHGITALSPLRHKDYLEGETKLADNYGGVHPLSSQRGIVTRDYLDVQRADAILMNLHTSWSAPKVSIGTMFEAAWALQIKKPLILLIDDESVHNHSFVREAASFIVPDMDLAIQLTVRTLTAS